MKNTPNILKENIGEIEELAIKVDLGVNGMRKNFDKSETCELVKKIKSLKGLDVTK